MKFKGGTRIGKSYWKSTNESFFFSSLEIKNDRLILGSFFHQQLYFEKDDINSLTLRFYMTSAGLRVIHHKQGLPHYVVFWTFAPKVLKKTLEAQGWHVESKQPVICEILKKSQNCFTRR